MQPRPQQQQAWSSDRWQARPPLQSPFPNQQAQQPPLSHPFQTTPEWYSHEPLPSHTTTLGGAQQRPMVRPSQATMMNVSSSGLLPPSGKQPPQHVAPSLTQTPISFIQPPIQTRFTQARDTPFDLSNNIHDSRKAVSSHATVAPSEEVDDELPLLEELGIYPSDIWQRMLSVLLCRNLDEELLLQLDMSGPTVILLSLGCMLLLAGKIHFGYIYALSTCGSFGLYVLLNLMSQTEIIDLYRTLSILGYSLLPIVILAMVAPFWRLRSSVGTLVSTVAILWSTATASRFFEAALGMKQQRFLIAFPVLLFYASFVLLTIF